MSEKAGTSIGQLIRASAISGAGSAVYILSGIIKTKVIAIFLGPSGVGLFGLFQSILSTTGTISGMGLGTSGVRQIAEARAGASSDSLGVTAAALWWASFLLGLLGAIVVILFRAPLAELSMGSADLSDGMLWIGFGVWFLVVSTRRPAYSTACITSVTSRRSAWPALSRVCPSPFFSYGCTVTTVSPQRWRSLRFLRLPPPGGTAINSASRVLLLLGIE